MTFSSALTISLNVAGLAIVATLEAWQPGSISRAVNVGAVWLIAVILIGVCLVLERPNNRKQH